MMAHDRNASTRRRTGARQLAALHERLSARDIAILRDIERFRLLTTRQIQRLHFATGHASIGAATRACTRVLSRLSADNLIAALNDQKRRRGGARRGSDQLVWQLAARGDLLLRHTRAGGYRKRYTAPSSEFVHHTLMVSELGVVLHEAAARGEIELIKLAVEGAAHQYYVGRHGAKSALKPDLHAITAGPEFEHHWFIEADRGTERGPHLLRKLTAYSQYFNTGRYQAEHGLFPSVLWVVPDVGRGRQLARLIEATPSIQAEIFQVCTRDGFIEHVVRKTLSEEREPPNALLNPDRLSAPTTELASINESDGAADGCN
ncbi:replication-relaxation family protein [Nocardia ninae]|uniref:Replication-relaxation n=1 Tax=Nocardia ninae NBRC 108245 TaxID=1210091 RepID=A0A511MD20_9NOCA|nr:replication-relaxation family protein [Nocardia ninae]GEM38564.1 hypothetical protein NN4_30830 [Nocardia ninae NBRC 108245]